MTKRLYTIYDNVSRQFCVYFSSSNDDDAKRQLRSTIKTGTLLGDHPEDYELLVVCDLDDDHRTVTMPDDGANVQQAQHPAYIERIDRCLNS